jgi:hypothetical protein
MLLERSRSELALRLPIIVVVVALLAALESDAARSPIACFVLPAEKADTAERVRDPLGPISLLRRPPRHAFTGGVRQPSDPGVVDRTSGIGQTGKLRRWLVSPLVVVLDVIELVDCVDNPVTFMPEDDTRIKLK